jgi:hypothetical protein
MQSKTRDVHVFDRLRRFERGQLHAQALRVPWLNTGKAARLIELPKTFVSEGLNHLTIVARCALRNKG